MKPENPAKMRFRKDSSMQNHDPGLRENGHRTGCQLKPYAGGQTPLSCAAKNGHNTIVKMLLDTCSIDLNTRDKNDQTPLAQAAQNGHDTVIKILLNTGKVDANAEDADGRTPLSCAAGNGHETVVKMLLNTGEADVNARDKFYNRTPLSWAYEGGE
ncbi:hypothetical protein N7540_004598 [Penicillium herquei]|nr:hypothetical protein N7540_004598 [Penicillium herquei]